MGADSLPCDRYDYTEEYRIERGATRLVESTGGAGFDEDDTNAITTEGRQCL